MPRDDVPSSVRTLSIGSVCQRVNDMEDSGAEMRTSSARGTEHCAPNVLLPESPGHTAKVTTCEEVDMRTRTAGALLSAIGLAAAVSASLVAQGRAPAAPSA